MILGGVFILKCILYLFYVDIQKLLNITRKCVMHQTCYN